MTVGFLKKTAAAVMLAAVLAMSSCSFLEAHAEGEELIEQAREAYTSLDSAKVIMTNTETGEVEQTFTFKYDEKDVLMYSYEGVSEKSEYAQFNNGVECFTYENGEYSHVEKGSDDFNLYTRAATHPQADEGLIIYSPTAIESSSVTDEDGVTHVEHVYNIDKIGAEVESGEVTGFRADFYFKDEELLYFTETTEAEEDGKEVTYCYRVEITEKNSVEKVENTVEKYMDNE